MNKPRILRSGILTVLLFIVASTSLQADEYYFSMIFGSQSRPKQLRYTHTWATFIKAVGQGPDLNTYAFELNTISWLPRSLDVKVWKRDPEPGMNLDLYQTLDYVYSNDEHVKMWGPFVSSESLYERALGVRRFLDGGGAEYRAIDGAVNLTVSDCIHAVAAVDPIYGRSHYPLIRIGKPASHYIARQLMSRGLIDQSLSDSSWLIPRLGLDRYPIVVVPPEAISQKRALFSRRTESTPNSIRGEFGLAR